MSLLENRTSVKILFLGIGLVHYYNLILNRLDALANIEILNLVPIDSLGHIGEGVYQTQKGVSFRICRLPQSKFKFFHGFRGFTSFLNKERPDIIVVSDYYLMMFLLNVRVRVSVNRLGIKIILKSIPFQVKVYGEALRDIRTCALKSEVLPPYLTPLIGRGWISKCLRRVGLELRKRSYRLPDAHVNYIEDAYVIYESYGVPRNRIFITYNSPDTDYLFKVRKAIAKESPILANCSHRLIHVGRLVPWKRTDMLIRAFSSIKKKFSNLELLIVGEGPEESNLKKIVESLGLSSSVKFLGGIYDPHLLGRYLMASTVYVLAGMGGISINDAMIFGLPIICSICDGTEKKLVRDGFNGFYFKNGDERDLERKITYLLEHPVLARKMGARSTGIIENEININTVINGYLKAFAYVTDKAREFLPGVGFIGT